jgi:fructokinase
MTAAMNIKPLFVGVELGGTKCVCILACGPNDILAEERIATRKPEETLRAIAALLSRWHSHHGFAALGLASFGPVDLDRRSPGYGTVVNTPKADWNGADIVGLGRSFDVPIGFDTDVNAAALAEGRWGGARGLRSFAYITVGTGVGSGSIVAGRPVTGLGHSEAGHLRVARMAGATGPGTCPYHGDCVEGLAAGPALAARAGRPAAELAADDPAWDETVHALAGLCHNLILTTVPERILIGGGVIAGQPQLLPRIRSALVASLAGYGMAPTIARSIEAFVVPPVLGSNAGPLGAIVLAQDAVGAS